MMADPAGFQILGLGSGKRWGVREVSMAATLKPWTPGFAQELGTAFPVALGVGQTPNEDVWAHRLHREIGLSWGSVQMQDSQVKVTILLSLFLTQPPCLPETSMANRTKLHP